MTQIPEITSENLLSLYDSISLHRRGIFSSFGEVMPSTREQWAQGMYDKFCLLCIRTDHEEYSIHQAAAFIFFHVIKTHPLLDGNKRSAMICACMLYSVYYHEKQDALSYIDTDKLYKYAKHIAETYAYDGNDEEGMKEVTTFFSSFFEE